MKPDYGYLVYRITNPNIHNNNLTPPFSHVRVQTVQPVPGQIYNVLYVAVRNGTAQTFDASSGFEAKYPNNVATFPILTGAEQWKPGQEFIFYVLTKKYYPLPSQVHSGFEFSLAGARSVAIPGPSGIFLRLKYNPATFDRTLDAIVAAARVRRGARASDWGCPTRQSMNSSTRRPIGSISAAISSHPRRQTPGRGPTHGDRLTGDRPCPRSDWGMMNSEGFVRRLRRIWTTTLALASLHACVEPAPVAAQQPAIAPTTAPPPVEPDDLPAARPTPPCRRRRSRVPSSGS